jgi:hypothetical protein
MNTVLFVQAQPRMIVPPVQHQTICNLIVLLVHHAMNTVLFVQAQPRMIVPRVQHQTICNLTVLLVIQLAHQLTTLKLAATHVSHVI